MIGKVVGNYHIVEKIGEGGMGAVYKGIDLMLERPVAIKVLHATMSSNEDLIERFRREAKALARFLHPNIAALYNLVHQEGEYYMIMEYIAGSTLESLIAEKGRLPYEQAHPLFMQILNGIGYAHNKGVIHRDIKPSNIILNDEGTVKITDFGIALMHGVAGLTQTGTTLGSLYYAAPEQIRAAHSVGNQADIYSLGIVLYQMLSGELPFKGESIYDVMRKHIEAPPPLLRRVVKDVPPPVEVAILQALAKDARDRFPDVEAFRQALPPTPLIVEPASASAPLAADDLLELEPKPASGDLKIETLQTPVPPLLAQNPNWLKQSDSIISKSNAASRSILVVPAKSDAGAAPPDEAVNKNQTPVAAAAPAQPPKPTAKSGRTTAVLVALGAFLAVAVVVALIIANSFPRRTAAPAGETTAAPPASATPENNDAATEPVNDSGFKSNSDSLPITIPFEAQSPPPAGADGREPARNQLTPTPTPLPRNSPPAQPSPAGAGRGAANSAPLGSPTPPAQNTPETPPPGTPQPKPPSTAPTIIP